MERVKKYRVRLSTTIPNLLAESFCSVTRTDPGPQVIFFFFNFYGTRTVPTRRVGTVGTGCRYLVPHGPDKTSLGEERHRDRSLFLAEVWIRVCITLRIRTCIKMWIRTYIKMWIRSYIKMWIRTDIKIWIWFLFRVC